MDVRGDGIFLCQRLLVASINKTVFLNGLPRLPEGIGLGNLNLILNRDTLFTPHRLHIDFVRHSSRSEGRFECAGSHAPSLKGLIIYMTSGSSPQETDGLKKVSLAAAVCADKYINLTQSQVLNISKRLETLYRDLG